MNGNGQPDRQRPACHARSSRWASRSTARTSFPSNISGLPTWYAIRVEQAGIYSAGVKAPRCSSLSTPPPLKKIWPTYRLAASASIRTTTSGSIGREDVRIIRYARRKTWSSRPGVDRQAARPCRQYGLCRRPGSNCWASSLTRSSRPVAPLQGKTKAVDLNYGVVERPPDCTREQPAPSRSLPHASA